MPETVTDQFDGQLALYQTFETAVLEQVQAASQLELTAARQRKSTEQIRVLNSRLACLAYVLHDRGVE